VHYGVGGPIPPLTRREREVLALLAGGPSNRQIAEVLGISERTAEAHVANILGKTGLTSRGQVIAWAARRER
jgi:non-specific serine/threonine protein kinase